MLYARLCGGLLLSQLVASSAINEGAFGQPFEMPQVIADSDGPTVDVTLTFKEYEYKGPSTTLMTRVYNDAMTGPTIRAKPGQTIRMTLKNELTDPGIDTNGFHNVCRDPSITNMHPHGLHVNATAPGDDVLLEVPPQSSYDYVYHIPEDHMGGTFWYHAHHHGSTNLQAGGGGGGMIIVDDPEGALPKSVADLEEMHLVLSSLDVPAMTRWSHMCIAQCSLSEAELAVKSPNTPRGTPPHNPADCAKAYGIFASGPKAGLGQNAVYSNGMASNLIGPTLCTGSNVTGPCSILQTVLVNGMSEPKITMVANRWYRWRMIFGAVQGTIAPKVEGCEMGLLSKDGIYLFEAPRYLSAGFMAPGNRADWVVRCPVGSHAFVTTGFTEVGGGGTTPNTAGLGQMMTQVLANVEATDQGEQKCDLDTFRATRPCYLADLTGYAGGSMAATPTATTGVAFPGLGMSNNVDGCMLFDGSPKHCGFNASYKFAEFPLGAVNAYEVKGLWAHPFHQHVNPFQMDFTLAFDAGGYFQRGDYHDTLLIPNVADNMDNAPHRLLTPTDKFAGPMAIHCHFLEHEDQGMMALVSNTGTDGARFDATSLLAAGETCYGGAFDKASHAPKIVTAGTCPKTAPSPPSSKKDKEWDGPAITLTVLASIILVLLLTLIIMMIMGMGKGAAAAADKKDVQFTSVSAAPPA